MKIIETIIYNEEILADLQELADEYEGTPGQILLAAFLCLDESSEMKEKMKGLKRGDLALQKELYQKSLSQKVQQGIFYLNEKFGACWIDTIDSDQLLKKGQFFSPLVRMYEGNIQFSLLSPKMMVELGFLPPDDLSQEKELWGALADEWRRHIALLKMPRNFD